MVPVGSVSRNLRSLLSISGGVERSIISRATERLHMPTMKNEIKRYIVSVAESWVDSIRLAFALAIKLCNDSAVVKSVVLMVPQLGTLQGDMEEALGNKTINKLLSGDPIQLTDGVKLRVKTQISLGTRENADMIIGVYPTEHMLDRIDAQSNVKKVIIVPWDQSDVSNWKNKWHPMLLDK